MRLKQLSRDPGGWWSARVVRLVVVGACGLTIATATASAQRGQPPAAPLNPSSDGAWFGVPLPPVFEPHVAPVIIGDRGPAPAVVPAGEEAYTALDGASIRADLETIVSFSHASRARSEIGSGQLWGRISGFESSRDTVAWTAQRFRAAGIDDVELQAFSQDPEASFWLPLSWELRLLGDDAFGDGSVDVVLSTAMPLAPSELEAPLTAPLVHVGRATPAELDGRSLAGAIAVQHVTPQAHLVFERGGAVPRARELFERGAVAVINVIDLPGNERARDFSNCGGPCVNLGGRDGRFLEAVMDRAAEAGVLDRLQARLELRTTRRSGLEAQNAVAVLPGSELAEEVIVVNAHADAWFDGAGDNGDGLAVLVALARHFGGGAYRPRRTMVFVSSAGHHSPGLHGPRQFVAMNPDLADRAVMVVNIEHVAQRNLSPARSLAPDGSREFVADVGEAPIVAGISNSAPFLEDLVRQGVDRYGTNFVSGASTMASGEGGGYRPLGVALVTTMQAPPLYHTSGEVVDVISTPGLERMARFLAFFLTRVDQAPGAAINP